MSNELGLVKGSSTGFGVRPTSELSTSIPADADVVILTSNWVGTGSTIANVNDPQAQANLDAFVQAGGVLVVHLADNAFESFKVPALDQVFGFGPYVDFLELAAPSHPIAIKNTTVPLAQPTTTRRQTSRTPRTLRPTDTSRRCPRTRRSC